MSVFLALGSLLGRKEGNRSSFFLGSVFPEVGSKGSSRTCISSKSEQTLGSRLKHEKLLVHN